MTDNDLISRSALLKELKEQHDYIMQDQEIGKTMKWCEAVCFHRTVEAVENAPAVDAETVIKGLPYVKEALEMAKQSLAPVRHGRWERYCDDKFMGYGADGKIKYRKVYTYECDNCRHGTAVKTNYCPNCGAKMDGDTE